MRAIANNNPLGDVVAEQIEVFLLAGVASKKAYSRGGKA